MGPFLGRADCRPGAPREDFQAEYERAARLLRERLGEPLPEGASSPTTPISAWSGSGAGPG
ncbi:hypothetical protein [Streptomyces milbemycinicus]|uniref:Uncharacterized protein n=1 Tax=Streptomyces milbemycinicus TaxID=476552 RepID=A0ABW8LWV5_9ACTN